MATQNEKEPPPPRRRATATWSETAPEKTSNTAPRVRRSRKAAPERRRQPTRPIPRRLPETPRRLPRTRRRSPMEISNPSVAIYVQKSGPPLIPMGHFIQREDRTALRLQRHDSSKEAAATACASGIIRPIRASTCACYVIVRSSATLALIDSGATARCARRVAGTCEQTVPHQ